MAITPTTWNPSDKGHNVSLSNGNLTNSYSVYYQNRVRAIAGVTSGKWYWESTLDSIGTGSRPMLGVCAASNYIGDNQLFPGELYVGAGGVGPGDIFGMAFDADTGVISIAKNGTALTSASDLAISGPFHPVCGGYDYDISGGTTSFTANFGASPFAYSVPSGYTPGIGAIPHSVTGSCETMYGTPKVDYPPVVKGVLVTQYGTPSAQQRYPVASTLPTSRSGIPHLKFDQTVQVAGTCETQYGRPRLRITLPPPNQICSVRGVRVTNFGTHTVRTAVTVQVTGTCETMYGTPVAGQGYPVTGSCETAYGTPTVTLGLAVKGGSETRYGVPTARMGPPVVGTIVTRYGKPSARAHSFHDVTGTCGTNYGVHRLTTMRVLVRSTPPVTRSGTPKLQAQPC